MTESKPERVVAQCFRGCEQAGVSTVTGLRLPGIHEATAGGIPCRGSLYDSVGPARLERAAYGLGIRRSIHLSYGPGNVASPEI